MVRAAYDSIAESWGRERESMDDPARACLARPILLVADWRTRARSRLRRRRDPHTPHRARAKRHRRRFLARAAGSRTRGLSIRAAHSSRSGGARARAASFDGVIAYDCLWHVPRDEHGAVLARIRRWMVDGAPLMLTVAR